MRIWQKYWRNVDLGSKPVGFLPLAPVEPEFCAKNTMSVSRFLAGKFQIGLLVQVKQDSEISVDGGLFDMLAKLG